MRQLHPQADVDPWRQYTYPTDREPWVRATMIASVDGAAWWRGRSGGLSSPADRRLFQVLRGLSDVILVGAGTARTERYQAVVPDPSWRTYREAAGQASVPSIAVVSGSLDLDPESRLFTGVQPDARTIVITTESAPAHRRRELESTASVVVAGQRSVDVGKAVEELATRRLTRVHCEGGPRLLAQLVAAGLVDELCLTVSPMLTAGSASRVLDGPGLPEATGLRLAHALEDDGSLFLRYLLQRDRGSAAS